MSKGSAAIPCLPSSFHALLLIGRFAQDGSEPGEFYWNTGAGEISVKIFEDDSKQTMVFGFTYTCEGFIPMLYRCYAWVRRSAWLYIVWFDADLSIFSWMRLKIGI